MIDLIDYQVLGRYRDRHGPQFRENGALQLALPFLWGRYSNASMTNVMAVSRSSFPEWLRYCIPSAVRAIELLEINQIPRRFDRFVKKLPFGNADGRASVRMRPSHRMAVHRGRGHR
jgi:hypothetical protein